SPYHSQIHIFIFSSLFPYTPLFPPFSYTTLFRSRGGRDVLANLFSGHAYSTQAARADRHRGQRQFTAAPRSSRLRPGDAPDAPQDRKSTRLNSSHSQISYAVFCLKKKTIFCLKTK